ncbi:type II toxin-antitoxin system Phd/YefM family antitoxin [Patescibacteria group bacterium]|nr:type II toxin-antitoxin system Phd/YefM family antitoxin [Patescibacteria group bacterium]
MLDDNIYSIRETREQLSRLVELAYLTGGRFLVTKFGKPRAALVPVPKDLLIKKRSIADYAGFMGLKGESGIELEDRMRRNKKERDYVKKLIS